MDEKSLDALRNGLEDSYWYGDDDEKVFNELVRKAKAFDDGKDRIYSKISHIIMNTEPDKIMPGYVNGMYHALDLLNEDVPDD